MERQILCRELYPWMGKEAERFIFNDQAGSDWHFSGRGDLALNEGPQPCSRAVAVLELVGVDWRSGKGDWLSVDNGNQPQLIPTDPRQLAPGRW